MTGTQKLYLMLHEEGDTGHIVSGATPAGAVEGHYAELDSEDFAAEVAVFVQENPGVTPTEINVVYSAAEGAKASELPRMPDFLHRRDEG